MRYTKLTLPVLVLALLAVACDENPDERTLIDEPRLLAVQSSPPVLRGLDGVVSLSALAVNEIGIEFPEEEVRFRVCSPWDFLIDPERDCPASRALLLDSRELTTQNVLEFYPPPEGLAPPDSGVIGAETCATPIAEVPVVAEMTSNGESLITVKRIPIYANEVRKQNPALDEVEILEVVDNEHTLQLSIDPASLDVECRDGMAQLEAIRIHVYSTSGSFQSSSADIVPTPGGGIEAAEMVWTSDGEPSVLLFVAIDRDGGIDWKLLSL